MQKKTKEILVALILGILFPAVLFSAQPALPSGGPQAEPDVTVTEPTSQTPAAVLVDVLMSDGTVAEMEMDAYITAVLLREMPAEFDAEALKAQAVVARTYTLKRQGDGRKHANGDICTEPACCQGYRSKEDYLQAGGSPELADKVRTAVIDTSGQVLLYNGKLIEATYYSCSGGMTEDALAVWGTDIPYLRATESPGEEGAAHYVDTERFTLSEFKAILGIPAAVRDCAIEYISHTSGGGVDKIRICGQEFTGLEMRQKLGLRSTVFQITVIGESVTITTKGFGHRVGMSQYGAEAMAVDGSTYDQILAHYYPGTELVVLDH